MFENSLKIEIYSEELEHILRVLRPGKHVQNQKIAADFLSKFPNDAVANQLMARTLVDGDRVRAALPYAQFAAQFGELKPEFVVPLVHIYFELRLVESAKGVLEAAIEKYPNSYDLHLALGRLYDQISKPDLALKHLDVSRQISKTNEDREEAQRAVALVLMSINQSDKALPILSDLKLNPKHRTFALTKLAGMKGTNGDSPIAQEIAHVLATCSDELKPRQKASLHLALGRLEERSKRYDLAFQNWQRAGHLMSRRYDANRIERLNENAISMFTAELFNRTRAYANVTSAPIFVVGLPRSGTTLMEQILGSHKLVAGIGEFGRLGQLNLEFLERHRNRSNIEDIVSEAANGELIRAADEFLNVAALVANKSAPHFVDKMPGQYLDAGYIHMCLPSAKFINMCRHPADTFISTCQNDFLDGATYAYDQKAYAHFYMARERLLSNWRALFPNQILDVSYENLVTEPEMQVRRILSFLGLEWDPACLRFFEDNRSVRTLSLNQVRQGIHTGSIGRWRNYANHLDPLFASLKKNGYQPNAPFA